MHFKIKRTSVFFACLNSPRKISYYQSIYVYFTYPCHPSEDFHVLLSFLGLCENCNMCLFFVCFFIPRNKGIIFRKPFMLIIIILAIIPCIYWEHLLFHYFFVNKITLSRAFFFWSVGSKKKGNQFRKGECARERERDRATYLVDRVEWMNEWVEMEMMHK